MIDQVSGMKEDVNSDERNGNFETGYLFSLVSTYKGQKCMKCFFQC